MGMSTLEEIEHWNLGYTQHDSAYPRTLLQCTSNYPSDPFNANLLAMINVGKQLKVDIGFSDHTPDHRCAVCAVAMGAKVVEKHFTLDKQLPGPDHKASSDVHEFKAYVQYIQDTVAICGKSEKRVAAEESDMRNISRKGVFTQKNLSKGETVLESDVLFRRPGTQMDMRTFQSMEGKVLNKDVPANTALSPSDFD
jgi:sialic acid synthase SpsE